MTTWLDPWQLPPLHVERLHEPLATMLLPETPTQMLCDPVAVPPAGQPVVAPGRKLHKALFSIVGLDSRFMLLVPKISGASGNGAADVSLEKRASVAPRVKNFMLKSGWEHRRNDGVNSLSVDLGELCCNAVAPGKTFIDTHLLNFGLDHGSHNMLHHVAALHDSHKVLQNNYRMIVHPWREICKHGGRCWTKRERIISLIDWWRRELTMELLGGSVRKCMPHTMRGNCNSLSPRRALAYCMHWPVLVVKPSKFESRQCSHDYSEGWQDENWCCICRSVRATITNSGIRSWMLEVTV